VLNGTLKRGVIAEKVDYVTRDQVAKGEYCDNGVLAAPYFTIIQNVYGHSRSAKLGFKALACSVLTQSGERLFGVQPPVDLQPRS